MTEPIPVVLLTGAPGQGKTSILNRLISHLAPGSVPAIITHRLAREFGLDIHPVVTTQASLQGEMFDFGGGCVCCSPTGDLLQHLLAVKSASQPKPTHVLIETSGLADPAVFLNLLLTHAELQGFELAAVVGVVDVLAAPILLSGAPAAVTRRALEQLHAADVVALVHCEEHDARTRACEILRTVLEGSSPRMIDADALRWEHVTAGDRPRHHLLRGEGGAQFAPVAGPISLGGGHDSVGDSVCLVEDGDIFEPNWAAFVSSALQLCSSGGSTLLRVKGVVSIRLRGPLEDLDRGAGEPRSAAPNPASVKRCVEWSSGAGTAVSVRSLDEALAACANGESVRHLAHSMVAGLDQTPGSCKVLFVGVRLPVNELRAALWKAMIPPGFELAAEIEIDFPEAWRHARARADREGGGRTETMLTKEDDEGSKTPSWAVRRLANWLGSGRDALLFWVGGAFCALADFDTLDERRWELERASQLTRILASSPAIGSKWRYVLAPLDSKGPALDLATGCSMGSADECDDPVPEPILRRLSLQIIGSSVYVSKAK